ncbi:gliding motility-associated ABC transporter ATP-binding subunit GldA [Cyclobacterium jeungdonense]|uniref:Gliding motility-associated ABC transporter ATP-binding subunit GldA n=1 Tax=Cyclobacterium jeungdonense TaxID=708087 RepID=A0ABT8CAL8_9BACT|nr:gliding motility-associated ABC transporter ATP-binding subunit GldA [Cyclobacterium jeungdonense]MDN3689182.1 gliding motility-associated ABC transporter ATP-binding subunit GldA [Cyclobacterium jeungdonense]
MSIEIHQLSKTFGSQQVLNEVSFQAKPGQVLGFLGPNGAGKSTTMKILTGYLTADEGDVLVKGISVTKHPKVISKLIGYLPEHNPLYPEMYIPEFLTFVGGLYQMEGKMLQNRVQTVMEQCGLMAERKKKIGLLSKGYKQRVGLARSLLHDPEIIVLDEPTSGLDPNQLVEIRQLIKTISENKTLILSTHIMQEVEALCDKVVIIHNGKIVAQDLLQHLKSGQGEGQLIFETEEALVPEWIKGMAYSEYSQPNPTTYAFSSTDPKQLRLQLMRLVQEKGLNLISVRQQENNLESIFYRLTQN